MSSSKIPLTVFRLYKKYERPISNNWFYLFTLIALTLHYQHCVTWLNLILWLKSCSYKILIYTPKLRRVKEIFEINFYNINNANSIVFYFEISLKTKVR